MNQYQKKIILVKRMAETGEPVKPQNCNGDPALYYYSEKDKESSSVYLRWDEERFTYRLITRKGEYVLRKHESQNYFIPEDCKTSIHVVLRPMGGELIYWLTKSTLKEAANV